MTPLIISVMTAIGALITVVVNAKKTATETKVLQEQQHDLKEGQNKVLAQFKNNGGSTMKDATDKIEVLLHETRADIRGMQKDIGRLAEVDMEDRQRAVREHERIYEAIAEVRNEVQEHIKEVPLVLKKSQEETIRMIQEIRNET